MYKKIVVTIALLALAVLIISACAPAATPVPPTAVPQPTTAPQPTAMAATEAPTAMPATEAPTAMAATEAPTAMAATAAPTAAATAASSGSAIKVGLVLDTGGPDDKSFNQAALAGLTEAQKDGLATTDSKYLQSRQQTDYAKNLEEFASEGAKGIVSIGFLMGVDTAKASKAHTDIDYAIVDYTFPDCFGSAVEGKDCGSASPLPNVLGLHFNVEQAAFQGGYLAAAMSKAKTVCTFGGVNIPPVVDYMVGFQAGVNYYNQKNSASVKVLGWDTTKNDGVFTADFNDPSKGKQAAESLFDEGCDVILPVAGSTGNGALLAAKDKNLLGEGVDVDQCGTLPDACPILLTSVRKNIDTAVHDAIKSMSDGSFKGGVYNGTLANNGVSIAPFNQQDANIPAQVKTDLDQIKADLIAGKIDITAMAKGGTAAPAATTAAPTAASSGSAIKVGLVLDTGGPDDKSFNQAALAGLTEAQKDGLATTDSKYLQSRQQTDYAKNLEEFASEGAKGIVSIGFLMGVDTAKASKAHTDIDYAIVDYTFPDCFGSAVEGKDCGSASPLPNVLGLHFNVEQAAFQGGYLAAAMSKAKTVCTFGGVNIPPVVDYMVGFQAGVNYYNKKNSVSVKVLGWDTTKNDGVFTADFNDPSKGKQAAESLFDEGCDVILPVAGSTGNGALLAAKDKNLLGEGVDVDQCGTLPDACPILLTSVRKNIDTAVHDAIKSMSDGSFKGGVYNGTLANNGVSIAPFNQQDANISAQIKSDLDQIKADLIAGKIDITAMAKGQ